MAKLATGTLASFDRTGLTPLDFIKRFHLFHFLFPPLPYLSQRDGNCLEGIVFTLNCRRMRRVARFRCSIVGPPPEASKERKGNLT
jgi:hypothetical protein